MQKPNLNKRGRKLVLGITGTFGSGKTTVAGIFKSFGAELIDADKLAHQCCRPGNKAYKRIIKAFGKEIIGKDKTINRKKLGKIAFNNRGLLKRLNDIIHPGVIRDIKSRIRDSKSKVIVLDAPLLIEAGLRRLVDKLIVVRITRSKQIERAKKKTPLSKTDILKRMKSQISQCAKLRFADFIIDNSGTIGETRKQAERIRRLLWKS